MKTETELAQYRCNGEHLLSSLMCSCLSGKRCVLGVGEQLYCRSIKGSVVITAEAVSVTSRLHYLVSFVPALAVCLIE